MGSDSNKSIERDPDPDLDPVKRKFSDSDPDLGPVKRKFSDSDPDLDRGGSG